MSGVGDTPRDLSDFIVDTRKRLVALERRRNSTSGSSGGDVPMASETVAGKAEIATAAETAAGTDDSRFVTPLKLKGEARRSGQRVIIPSASSGSVAADGGVTFTSLADLTLDGIFSGEFPRYKLFIEVTSMTTPGSIFLRFRAGGVTQTAANYAYTRDYGSGNTASAPSSSAQPRIELAGGTATRHDSELTLLDPQGNTPTRLSGITASLTATVVPLPCQVAGYYTSNAPFDGVSIIPASGAFTGTCRVLGIY